MYDFEKVANTSSCPSNDIQTKHAEVLQSDLGLCNQAKAILYLE